MKRWQWMAMWIAAAAIGVAQPESITRPDKIKIVLPAEAVVEGPQVCLSSIGVLECPASLTGQAGDLTLGTFVSKGQILWIDHNTILSRLASIGVEASCVELSGAEVVKVKRKETTIASEKIAQKAKDYLEQQLAGQKIASLSLFRQPTSIVLDDPNTPAELSCTMSRYQTPGTLKVDVAVSQKGLACDHSEVIFTVRYKVRQAVALKEIEAGAAITSENVQVQEVQALSPEQKMEVEPYGMLARRKIMRGAMVRSDWLAPRQTPVMIRRNQQVLVKVDAGGLYLSATGQAMEEGRVGDVIRIRRGQRPEEVMIYCTVQPDGTVQPQI
jgi:flagella basal body P-ring formation protein FlgA